MMFAIAVPKRKSAGAEAAQVGKVILVKMPLTLLADNAERLIAQEGNYHFSAGKVLLHFRTKVLGSLFMELLAVDKLNTGNDFGDEFRSIETAPVFMGFDTQFEYHGQRSNP